MSGDATTGPLRESERSREVLLAQARLRAAAAALLDFAGHPVIEASQSLEPPWKPAEFWKTVTDSLTAASEPDSVVKAAAELEEASGRLRQSLPEWAFFLEVAVAPPDVDVAQTAHKSYLRDRRDVVRASRAVLTALGDQPRRWSRVTKWLIGQLSDPKSWTIFLAVVGVVSFGLVRLLDLIIYAPIGVTPDEVGRDSVTVIPYALALFVLLTVVALVGAFGAALLAAVPLTAASEISSRRRARSGAGRKPITATERATEAQDDSTSHPEPRGSSDPRPTEASATDGVPTPMSAAPPLAAEIDELILKIFGWLGAITAVVLFALYVILGGTRAQIADCRADSEGDFIFGGWQSAQIVDTDPQLPLSVRAHRLAYVGTGPSHIVFYDCTDEETIRLPKSYSLTVDPTRPAKDEG